jgi:tripartite-type tricarboxylate transporter receptor subunit TctC
VAELTGQPVVVENKPGAGGTIGSAEVARAPADGHTLLITSSAHVANQFLIRNIAFDALRDFAPVTPTLKVPLVLVVHPGLGVRTLAELTQLAKRSPGKLSFAAGSSGALVGMELYKQLAGLDILHVPYKSNTQALADVMSGQVPMMISDIGLAHPQIKAGKVTGIAVTGTDRAPSLAELPTMAEAGVPGYELIGWGGIWAPAGTPAPVVARLNSLFGEALNAEPVRAFVGRASGEIFRLSPADFDRFQRTDTERWRRVTTAARIQPE